MEMWLWFLKRMESAWSYRKRTIMEEHFFFYEKLGRSCLMTSEFTSLAIILSEEFCIDLYDKLFMVNVQ